MGRPLVFALNGKRVELDGVDPGTTVVQYIRSDPSLQGTKLSCGEGGCGACTVLLSKYDPQSKRVEELTINSCLALLCSIDGCAITTTEGIKNSKNELHAVHKRLKGFHGSQCGFCTPGMSISIYGGLRKAAAVTTCNGHSHSNGFTAEEAEKCIRGNICRCTGYRPILDACKSFSHDVDVEDLGVNVFWTSNENADATRLPLYNPQEDPKFPSFLIEELEARVAKAHHPANGLVFKHVDGPDAVDQRLWRTATSLPEVFNILEEYRNTNQEVKLVVGNTSAGVFKDMKPQVYVDVSHIPELQAVKVSKGSVEVGAGVSISNLITIFEAETDKTVVYTESIKHLKQIASIQVRNRASVGGNLILAKNFVFDSDLATILVGAGAEVTEASLKEEKTLPLEEFLSQRGVKPGTLLISIRIPSWRDVGPRLFFHTYRASCRPNGNAVSYGNAALLAIVDQQDAAAEDGKKASPLVIKHLRLAFGAYGGPHATRAENTEKLLVGKTITPSLLREAVNVLKEEIKSPSRSHKSAYRSSLVVAFFFDFFNSYFLSSPGKKAGCLSAPDFEDEVLDVNGEVADKPTQDGVASHETASINEPQVFEFGRRHPKVGTKVVSSSQKFAVSKEFWPVAQPTPKVSAQLQASGEAVYVDDITPLKGTLYATFVLNDKPLGKILSIDPLEALKSSGAVDFVSAKDIPGANIGYSFLRFKDRPFVEDTAECLYDIVGLVVADSHEHAKAAATKVKIHVEEMEEPIYTIDEAIMKKSYKELDPMFADADYIAIGNPPAKSDHRIENGVVTNGSQYYFYMETQSVYAIPDEDGCLTVYCSHQGGAMAQKDIATCLDIPMNNVRVIIRRLGGAFGGKATRGSEVAVACALAAYKLKRPVKIYLDRQTDMRMCPGRHEVKATYSVDFSKDGKIASLQANVFLDVGRGEDMHELALGGLTRHILQYDWGSVRIEGKQCKTNKVSRGIMRAPGDTQGHFIAETIIEHVAGFLGIDAYKVRERNMHSVGSLNKFFPQTTNSAQSNTIPRIWQTLKEKSQFEKRQLAVKEFNEGSKWVKKGIDMVLALYETEVLSREARVSVFEDGSVVVEAWGVDMGQGLWTKVKQSVAYGLSNSGDLKHIHWRG